LQNSTLDPEKRYYFVSKAIAQVERLNELIADLSKLNKIEEARDLYPFELINIHNLVQDVAENLLPSSPDREITVNNQISSDLQLRGNSSLLFSVFLNLMENAIKYGGENVCITIAQYHQDEKFYHFVFTDNGPGIPEGHSLRIFERFYRIDDGRSRKTGGTGLGLAIVKNAIQLHNGDISVKNRPEGGLEFLFTLAK
jgi:signal transduction histidine kinase